MSCLLASLLSQAAASLLVDQSVSMIRLGMRDRDIACFPWMTFLTQQASSHEEWSQISVSASSAVGISVWTVLNLGLHLLRLKLRPDS